MAVKLPQMMPASPGKSSPNVTSFLVTTEQLDGVLYYLKS